MSMTEQQSKQRLRNRLVLVAVVLVFLAPLLLAGYVAGHKSAQGGGQHGILITPPRLLEDRELIDPVAGIRTTLHGKWTMFALIEGECNKDCVEVLYRMRQIRLAMGRRALRVQRAVYFAGEGVEKNARSIFSEYEGQLYLQRNKTDADFRKNFLLDGKQHEDAIYLIDSRGFLMMCYPGDTNPSGIIKDLERLLKTTG